jgi:hypothetical protein
MEKNYSKNEILKFIYGELEPAEERDFIEALYSDADLFQEFEELQESQTQLNAVEINFHPSEESLKAVMKHVTQGATRTKRSPIGLVTGKGIPGVKFFATVGMVTFSVMLIAFMMVAYQKAAGPETSNPEDVLAWEAPAIQNNLTFVKASLGNMSGKRELLVPVRHKTYRVVNTADYKLAPAPVVLVNVK